jgi:SSS family solute:Na+ symporter
VDTARKGALFGGYLKLLPLFIFMLPGVVAYAIAQRKTQIYSLSLWNGETGNTTRHCL